MKDDLEGALALLVPQVVEETFGGGGGGGGQRRRTRRRMRVEVVVGQEQQQHKRQQQRSRELLVEYDPNADPATVDSLEDIGEFIVPMCCVFYC